MKEAAHVFATRAARRKYGRGAYARNVVQDCYTQDGTQAEYCAFIGYTADRRFPDTTTGSNVHFAVTRMDQ